MPQHRGSQGTGATNFTLLRQLARPQPTADCRWSEENSPAGLGEAAQLSPEGRLLSTSTQSGFRARLPLVAPEWMEPWAWTFTREVAAAGPQGVAADPSRSRACQSRAEGCEEQDDTSPEPNPPTDPATGWGPSPVTSRATELWDDVLPQIWRRLAWESAVPERASRGALKADVWGRPFYLGPFWGPR